MKEVKQWILVCFLTFAFWGVLYPQFSLVEESYEYVAVYEKPDVKADRLEIKEKEKNPKKDFIAILNADAGELRFRSKLWETWKEMVKKGN